MQPLEIRFATDEDASVAVRLLTAQLVEHHLPADPAGVARGVELARLPHSPAWLLLAWRGEQAVGILLANQIVTVEKSGYALWVEELYVVPEARRTGVARAILERALDEARARGIRSIDLEVVPSQAAAFGLYRSLGFIDVDRQRLSKPV
jgi:ribosomal protein S18 acetylase RimI-like enzyme